MTRSWKLSFVLTCILSLSCHAVANDDIVYPFDVNTLLTCHVPDPNLGPLDSMPEPHLRVPLQPGATGTVWRPALSGFRPPSTRGLDEALLQDFLGTDFNRFFSSVNPPTDGPSLALESLTVEGSGGSRMLFVENPTPPIPNLEQFDNEADRDLIRRWIRDAGLGNCEVVAEWIQLNDTYFPRFFSGSRCSAVTASCSFPSGQTCEPDVGPGRVAYITVLRWDCCWSYGSRRWRWECGWRKVEAPIIVDCVCGCQPRLRTDFNCNK